MAVCFRVRLRAGRLAGGSRLPGQAQVASRSLRSIVICRAVWFIRICIVRVSVASLGECFCPQPSRARARRP